VRVATGPSLGGEHRWTHSGSRDAPSGETQKKNNYSEDHETAREEGPLIRFGGPSIGGRNGANQSRFKKEKANRPSNWAGGYSANFGTHGNGTQSLRR